MTAFKLIRLNPVKAYNFELLVGWPSTKSIIVKKTFYATKRGYAWGAAKRWRFNCLAICGKNELGEQSNNDTLSIVLD